MCNKAVDNYPHALEIVPECYKTQKLCDKAVVTNPPTIQFVPECYKTQKMCYKAVYRCFFCIWFCTWSINSRNMLHSCFFISFLNSTLPW